MPAYIGRKVAFTWDGAAITGVRERGISINRDAIDITSEEDNGLRTVLAEAAELSWEISIAGVAKEDTLLMAGGAIGAGIKAVTITYPASTGTGKIISGNFYLSAYSESDPHRDASTFQATLMSSGAVTVTPAAP